MLEQDRVDATVFERLGEDWVGACWPKMRSCASRRSASRSRLLNSTLCGIRRCRRRPAGNGGCCRGADRAVPASSPGRPGGPILDNAAGCAPRPSRHNAGAKLRIAGSPGRRPCARANSILPIAIISLNRVGRCLELPQSETSCRIVKLARKISFSRHVRDARISRGLSIADVANRVGVSPACVYFWEQGRTRPRDQNLVALCKALKLPLAATRAIAGS